MKLQAKIRVLIVDDHFMVRLGLSDALSAEPDLDVVGEATNGLEAIEAYRRLQPDVALIDLRLPDMTGIRASESILAEFPAARILIISTYDGSEDIHRALEAGVLSYLRKDAEREEVLRAVRSVAMGGLYLPPLATERIAERLSRPALSAREIDVLTRLASGMSNKEIAAQLFISEVTVKAHVSSILAKLNAADRTQAATQAMRQGIIHLDWS
jgi:DNA-binding NarL/FixJ family response regulator